MNSCLKLSLQQNCLIIVLKNVAHRVGASWVSLVMCVCVMKRNDISIQIPISDENMPSSQRRKTGFIFTTFVLKTFVAKVKFLFSETTFNWILCIKCLHLVIFLCCVSYSVTPYFENCEKKEQRSDKMSYIGRVYLFTY